MMSPLAADHLRTGRARLLPSRTPPEILGSAGASPSHRSGRGWLLWPVLVLLGFLLFAHLGCHGDEDNELFHGFGTGIGIGCDRNCTLDRN
jgi:hypothetical protein